MKNIIIIAFCVFFASPLLGQLTQFRMIGSGSWSTVNDSTFSSTVTIQSDLTANSFLPTGITDSMKIFTQNGQRYRISIAAGLTFSTADLTVVEVGGDWGIPMGQVMIYEDNGRDAVPAIPFGATGATAKMQEAVDTYNSIYIGSGVTSGGGSLDSLTVDLKANNYKIIDLGTPINPYDAANKNYVDQQVSTATDNQTAAEVNYDNSVSGSDSTTTQGVLDSHEERLKAIEGDTITAVPFGVVYYPFNDTTRVSRYGEANADIYISDPLGSNVLTGSAININWNSPGLSGFEVPLDTILSDTLYITFYMSIADNENLAYTGYTQVMSVNFGAGDTGTEVFDLIPQFNNGGNNVLWYAQTGSYLPLTPSTNRPGYGSFTRFELMLDKVGDTYNMKANDYTLATGSIANVDNNYLFFGGSLAAGFHIQVQHLTIDTIAFAPRAAAGGDAKLIGKSNTYYLADSGIDSVGVFQYDCGFPYDPDGGVNYINGPATFFSDLRSNNIGKSDSVYILLNRGDTTRQRELTLTGRPVIPGTTGNEIEAHIIEDYGDTSLPKPHYRGGISIPSTGWATVDATKGIYSYTFANSDSLTRASYVTVHGGKNAIGRSVGSMALRDADFTAIDSSSVLDTMKAHVGTYYLDVGDDKVFVRLYDSSNVNTVTIDIASIDGPGSESKGGSIIRNIEFSQCGYISPENGLTEYCEGNFLWSVTVSKKSIFRYNSTKNVWGGYDYYVNGSGQVNPYFAYIAGAYDGVGPRAISTSGDSSIIYGNLTEEGQISMQINFANKASIITHNVFKNPLITGIQASGGIAGGSTWLEGEKVIVSNNTVFQSQRHIDNDPYPLAGRQPGHAIVIQSGGNRQRYEFLNNAFLVHLGGGTSYDTLDTEGGSVPVYDLIQRAGSDSMIVKSDYNLIWVSRTSVSSLVLNYDFDVIRASQMNPDTNAIFKGLIDGTLPEGNSRTFYEIGKPVNDYLPVRIANSFAGSGKFLATNPRLNSDSNVRGAGYIYTYPQWAINRLSLFGISGFTDYYGNDLNTTERSIGAVEYR